MISRVLFTSARTSSLEKDAPFLYKTSKLPSSIASAPSSTAFASSSGTIEDTNKGKSVILLISLTISASAQISTALAPACSAAATTFLILSISKLSIPAIILTAFLASKSLLNDSILLIVFSFFYTKAYDCHYFTS